MTGTQIYNTIWLTIWLMGFVASIYGIIAGNWFYWIMLAFTLYFSALLLFDKEDGESLYQFFSRKIKAHKGGK